MVDIGAFFEVFIPLFIIINPLAILPIFTDIVRHVDKRDANRLSIRATVPAFALLSFFVIAGTPFLNLIGITTSAFMIACGILLLYTALGMLSGNPPITRNVEIDSSSIVPMSIPLLVGPGSIATAIVLENSYGKPLVFASVLLCMILSLIIFGSYKFISRSMGKNGLNAWNRLSALFFAAIAVNLITSGIGLIAW